MFDDDEPDFVEEHFPYDGPHNPDQAREAASALADLVRYLNNATGPGNDAATLPYAPHAYRLIGSTNAAVGGMDQLFAQLSRSLSRFANDPTLYDDRRGEYVGGHTASEAAYALDMARDSLRKAASDLQRAWGLTSHLGHD